MESRRKTDRRSPNTTGGRGGRCATGVVSVSRRRLDMRRRPSRWAVAHPVEINGRTRGVSAGPQRVSLGRSVRCWSRARGCRCTHRPSSLPLRLALYIRDTPPGRRLVPCPRIDQRVCRPGQACALDQAFQRRQAPIVRLLTSAVLHRLRWRDRWLRLCRCAPAACRTGTLFHASATERSSNEMPRSHGRTVTACLDSTSGSRLLQVEVLQR